MPHSFFRKTAQHEGPDICCRVVKETSVKQLAMIGQIVLGATTPAEALHRVVKAMPYHSSHEFITLSQTSSNLRLREGWTTRLDEETLHLIQQFFTSIIGVIASFTMAPAPLLSEIKMVPHPEFGFTHLENWFATRPTASEDHSLSLKMPSDIANRRFFRVARDKTHGEIPPGLKRLNSAGALSDSAKSVIALHLTDGIASVGRLASSAGLSQRTLQRQLSQEQTTFSELLEEVRVDLAVKHLKHSNESMDCIAAKLGYERQSTLSRAVRRWTGKTPSHVRKEALA